MDDEIEKIIPPELPFGMDDKVFRLVDEETGECFGEPYSYNDWIKMLTDISGINPDLLGMAKEYVPTETDKIIQRKYNLLRKILEKESKGE